MKKALFVLLALIVLSLIYLFIKGSNTQEIKTEINISSPPERVWAIIVDVEKWHEWSPIINASQGSAKIGAELNITMIGKEKGEDGPSYKPVITELNEPSYFHWRAHMITGFVFTNEKILRLEATESGTKLIHIETFNGMMAPLMSGSVEKNVPSMLDSMNIALKELAEK